MKWFAILLIFTSACSKITETSSTRSANVSNSEVANVQITISEIKSQPTGSYFVEAFVLRNTVCDCPAGGMCKCPPSGTVIAHENKASGAKNSWGAENDAELFLAGNPESLQVGKKYRFTVKVDRAYPGWQAYAFLQYEKVN